MYGVENELSASKGSWNEIRKEIDEGGAGRGMMVAAFWHVRWDEGNNGHSTGDTTDRSPSVQGSRDVLQCPLHVYEIERGVLSTCLRRIPGEDPNKACVRPVATAPQRRRGLLEVYAAAFWSFSAGRAQHANRALQERHIYGAGIEYRRLIGVVLRPLKLCGFPQLPCVFSGVSS